MFLNKARPNLLMQAGICQQRASVGGTRPKLGQRRPGLAEFDRGRPRFSRRGARHSASGRAQLGRLRATCRPEPTNSGRLRRTIEPDVRQFWATLTWGRQYAPHLERVTESDPSSSEFGLDSTIVCDFGRISESIAIRARSVDVDPNLPQVGRTRPKLGQLWPAATLPGGPECSQHVPPFPSAFRNGRIRGNFLPSNLTESGPGLANIGAT